MKAYLMMLFLMTVGAAIVLWMKGMWQARSDGNKFDVRLFTTENLNRLVWTAFGLVVFNAALYFAPEELATLVASLPLEIQIVSPLMLGAGLAGTMLIIPKNKGEEE